jgi:iron complex transport system permease protein
MNKTTVLCLLVLLTIVTLCVAPFVGRYSIPLTELWRSAGDSGDVNVLWMMRIPRMTMIFLAGMALAVSGMVFQAMFRNPLATPYTLGISSGASLGASICISQAWVFSLLGIPSVTICAFAGAVLTIVLVYFLTTRTPQGSTTATMLLAGVALSFFFSSLILFLQ